jgi:hypothetical protein
MMRNTKRSLFGGALIAAGLIAPAASGRSLIWDYSTIGVQASDQYDLDPIDEEQFSGPGPFLIGAATEHSWSSAKADYMAFHIQCDSSGKDYLGAGEAVSANFRVDEDGWLIFYWDLTAGQSWGHMSPAIKVDDVTHGFNVLTADKFVNPVSSGDLYAFAGIDYTVYGGVSAFDGMGRSYFYMDVFIPGPGAIPALSVAGLAAARRRR